MGEQSTVIKVDSVSVGRDMTKENDMIQIESNQCNKYILVTMYLITTTDKAYALVMDVSLAKTIFEKLCSVYSDKKFRIQKISTNLSRIKEIGKNLFNSNFCLKLQGLSNESILELRNKITQDYIHRMHSIENANGYMVWKKLKNIYGEYTNEFESIDEFNSCVMDFLKFVRNII